MKRLIVMLLIAVAAYGAECPAVKLDVGQFVNSSCHIFRIVQVNEVRYVTKEKGGKVTAREAIDCTRAVLDEDGTMEYWSRLANTNFYCPHHIEDRYAQDKTLR